MKIIKAILLVVLIVFVARLLLYLIAPPKIELTFSRGDTVHEFAQLLGVSPSYLLHYNKIKNPRTIAVGSKISVPMPVIPYLRFRFGLQKQRPLSGQDRGASPKPLVFSRERDISGTVFYGPDVRLDPNPKILCAKHMILGHFFLAESEGSFGEDQKFDFVTDENKLRLYDLAGDNPVLCPVVLHGQNEYELDESLLAQFVSIWNTYRLQDKFIVFYRGEL
jgi:LysM repeat protein